MFKEWNRVFPESWRNTWRRSVGPSFLTINLNGVQYLDTHLHVPTNSHSFSVHLYHAIVLHRRENRGCCSVFFFVFLFVCFSREWEWWSEEHKVVSSISPAGQREEKSRESEGDLPGKHSSFAKTDSTLPLCKSSVNQHVANQNKLIIQYLFCWFPHWKLCFEKHLKRKYVYKP